MAVPLSALVSDPLGEAVMETSLPLPEKSYFFHHSKLMKCLILSSSALKPTGHLPPPRPGGQLRGHQLEGFPECLSR